MLRVVVNFVLTKALQNINYEYRDMAGTKLVHSCISVTEIQSTGVISYECYIAKSYHVSFISVAPK